MYTLSLEIINKCNLNCTYCYLGEKKNTYMSVESAKKAVDIAVHEAQKQYDKTLIVYFIGGEPLMAFETMKSIVDYANGIGEKNGLKVKFSTTINGTLITRENVELFIKNDFEIKVSIDGPQFVHDLNRHDYVGNGSYNRIMERLPYLREYEEKTGKTVAYAHVVTKNNYQFFEQSFRFLLDLKADKIESGIDYYCQGEPSEILELKEQIRRTFNLFKEEVKKRGKSFYWNLFEQHLQAFLVPCDFYACKAGLNNVYVATDGNIYTCIELPEFKIGNVNEGLNVLRIREIVNREDKAYQLCKQCDFMSHCETRGCQASNIEINGNVYQPVEINCQVTKVMYELIENNISKNQLDKMGEELKGKRIYEK